MNARYLVLLGFAAACASTSAADVRRMNRSGDVDGLVATWDGALRDGLRTTTVLALADHADDPRARRIVIDTAARHPSEPVRLAALRGLDRIEGDDVDAVLIAGLGDPWPTVRDTSSAALESRAATASLEVAARSNTNHLVRAASVRLLVNEARRSKAQAPMVVSVLEERARTDDAPKVREAAVRGLGALRVVASRRLLRDLERTDGDPSVRIAAGKAIASLGDEPETERVVVAVLPLENEAGDDPELARLGDQLREYVAARLSGAQVCEVVDRERTDRAIAEMRKVGKALYDGDAPNAPEIGNFKLANQLVYGSVRRQGMQFTIVLSRMDVETLALVPGASATATGYRADLEQLKVEVTERFLARF